MVRPRFVLLRCFPEISGAKSNNLNIERLKSKIHWKQDTNLGQLHRKTADPTDQSLLENQA